MTPRPAKMNLRRVTKERLSVFTRCPSCGAIVERTLVVNDWARGASCLTVDPHSPDRLVVTHVTYLCSFFDCLECDANWATEAHIEFSFDHKLDGFIMPATAGQSLAAVLQGIIERVKEKEEKADGKADA